MQEIVADPIAHVTFTGGDPFFQAEGFAELAERIKKETRPFGAIRVSFLRTC